MLRPHTLVWASVTEGSSREERDHCDNCATEFLKSVRTTPPFLSEHLSEPRNHIPGKKYKSQVNVLVFRKYTLKLTGGRKHGEGADFLKQFRKKKGCVKTE